MGVEEERWERESLRRSGERWAGENKCTKRANRAKAAPRGRVEHERRGVGREAKPLGWRSSVAGNGMRREGGDTGTERADVLYASGHHS